MRAREFITESVQEVTLNDLYHNNYPDQDELIWNYVGKNDFDTQFTVRKINPLDLEEMLCDNYGVDDVQDLFKKMQPEQEDIVRDYQNDPGLSQKIIVTSGRRILDGNHRALAAVLARKPIKYIDVSEEQPERIDEGLSWISLDEGLSLSDKISIFEEYHIKGNLVESLDQDKKSYFTSLFDMSDMPQKGKKFIVVPLSLIGNKILPLDKPNYMEFVGKSAGQLIFNYNNREIRYPSKTMRDLSLYNTFTFSKHSSYDKFRVALSLKFDTVLPDVDNNVDEGLRDFAAAGIASLGLMGAPNLAAAAAHAAPQKQTHAQVQTKAPTAAAAKTAAKTAATATAKAPAKPAAKAPAKPTVKTLSKHPERETVIHKAAAKSGMKGAELAQFLAQTKHESWDFGKLKEKGTSDDFKKYDIRYNPDTARILGNTQKGDGERYRGRGFIQLTGRYNYRKAGEALGLPLEKKPDLASRPDIAARIAIWYWMHRVRPNVDNFKDTAAVTKHINPSLMGLRSRKQNFQDYLHLLANK